MTEQKEDNLVDVQETINRSEEFLEKNQKNLMFGGTAILAVVAGIFYYFNMYLPPLEKEAASQMYQAQRYFKLDSFQLAMYGSAGANSFMGFEEIMNEYGATKAGNASKYYMGVSLLRTGDFEGAIDFLSSYKAEDIMTASIAEGAIGDAHAELGNLDDALSHYEKASATNPNGFSTPIYLMKAGQIAERLGKYDKAVKLYTEVKNKYPRSQEARKVEKYISRASAYAG